MNNFKTLYYYEIKKITTKKSFWITLFLCIACIFFSTIAPLLGNYYENGTATDTNYHKFLVEKEHRLKLSGREINQELLDEMYSAFQKVPWESEQYTLTKEYQTYARPYSDIFYLIQSWTGMNDVETRSWSPDEATLYSALDNKLKHNWESNLLSEEEKLFWENKDVLINKPFTYIYHCGYDAALESFLTVGFIMLLFIAICLSGVFPEEHTRRTDQLVLSSINGKDIMYWVKLCSGVTVSVICAFLMSAITLILSLTVYGSEGFNAAFQLFYISYSMPITMGQAYLIAYGCLIITAAFVSILVMLLSETLHSNIAAMSITSGLIILGMLIQIPSEYRFLSQLWDYLPTSFLAMWNVFDQRLISVLGNSFTTYQTIPIIYIVCSILASFFGIHIYKKYQISGR